MPTRRAFLQTLATLAPASALTVREAWPATADPARVALVIGNNAYADAPLENPANDARAMAALLTEAGFTVETVLDAHHEGMLAAVDRLGAAIRKTETKQVLFYYAGHGVQLDWRNYMLPVDARAMSADQVRQSCMDLGRLLEQCKPGNDRNYIIILDACRDNPFGRGYRPEKQGLSQFDAPVGSLLAYATAPGRGAADGRRNGKNGLYTEHLVRELSIRNVRIEDAFKRVRLNVRLASGGLQVPWETTSLESDFYLFNEGRQKLSDAELEKQLEADLAAWARIQASKKVDDWVAYLRDFPNGRFAEIAQVRLARLLAPPDPAAVREARPAVAAEEKPAVVGKAAIPRIMNEADYEALPKGSTYYDPNGNLRRKS